MTPAQRCLVVSTVLLATSVTALIPRVRAAESDPHVHHQSERGQSTVNDDQDAVVMDEQPGAMDHGDMRAQGGSPPPNARDPHAYADGLTLEEGPYVLPGPRLLKLADEHSFFGLLMDRFEWVDAADPTVGFDAQAWYGRDYQRLVLKSEGEYVEGSFEELSNDLLYSHALSGYWNAQLGLRHDSGEGPSRSWLAIGVQGLAPYWFEVDATVYVGEGGRTAANVEAEYDLLLTQRLVLQSRAEFNAYSKKDAAAGIGTGLTDASVGLRLRYDYSRQLGGYLGLERVAKFGDTADFARLAGEPTSDTRVVAGVRFWF